MVLLVKELIKNEPEKLEKIMRNPEIRQRLTQMT